VTAGTPPDVGGLLALAAQVEGWFGPMVDDPGFHEAMDRAIQRGTAWVVRSSDGRDLLGSGPPRHGVVCSAVPCRVDVVTFGPDHPAATDSGARAFYDRLGFVAGADAPPGPDGGSRQWFHRTLS